MALATIKVVSSKKFVVFLTMEDVPKYFVTCCYSDDYCLLANWSDMCLLIVRDIKTPSSQPFIGGNNEIRACDYSFTFDVPCRRTDGSFVVSLH